MVLEETFADILGALKKTGMATMSITVRNCEGVPQAAVIAVRGEEETREILSKVAEVEDSWDVEEEYRRLPKKKPGLE